MRIQPDLAGGKIRGCVSFIALALTAAASNVYALVAWCHGSIGCGICLKPGPDSQTGLNLLFYRDGRGGCFFCVFNPMLWPDPVNRLIQSVQFHFRYSVSHEVTRFNLPFYQPILNLMGADAMYRAAIPIELDGIIDLLALAGLPSLYKKWRPIFLWLIIGLVFLLAWNTKWPQYNMVIVAPCVFRAEGLQFVGRSPGSG